MKTKNKNILNVLVPALGLCLPITGVAAEHAEYSFDQVEMQQYQEAQVMQNDLLDGFEYDSDKQSGSFDVAHSDEQDAVLKLYVRADQMDDMDAIAEQLNAIEPTVGVQFDIDF